MAPVMVTLSNQIDVPILGCPRCDTAMLPAGDWPGQGAATARCPLCGFEQPVQVADPGNDIAFPYNAEQQRQDAAATPLYQVESVSFEEDLVLVDIPELMEDGAFFALQDGVAPVAEFGWAGGAGFMGDPHYRLILVVRVSDLPEENLFRVEFPAKTLPRLAELNEDHTFVLVSQRKGVFFPEAGEVYVQAMREAGARPGDQAPINTWVRLEDAE